MHRLGWKTIEELIAHESKLMVFKSLHGLAPQYMSDSFTKIYQLTSHSLHNIATDPWLSQKISSNDQSPFPIGVPKQGAAYLPNASKQ